MVHSYLAAVSSVVLSWQIADTVPSVQPHCLTDALPMLKYYALVECNVVLGIGKHKLQVILKKLSSTFDCTCLLSYR